MTIAAKKNFHFSYPLNKLFHNRVVVFARTERLFLRFFCSYILYHCLAQMVHSLTAKTVGIEREDAKVVNYSRIYGAGIKFIISLLKLFKPSLTEEEVRAKGKEIVQVTKGRRG